MGLRKIADYAVLEFVLNLCVISCVLLYGSMAIQRNYLGQSALVVFSVFLISSLLLRSEVETAWRSIRRMTRMIKYLEEEREVLVEDANLFSTVLKKSQKVKVTLVEEEDLPAANGVANVDVSWLLSQEVFEERLGHIRMSPGFSSPRPDRRLLVNRTAAFWMLFFPCLLMAAYHIIPYL